MNDKFKRKKKKWVMRMKCQWVGARNETYPMCENKTKNVHLPLWQEPRKQEAL